MTEYEFYLDKICPEIELIKKSIFELNKLDLTKITVEQLALEINKSFPIITLSETIWDSKYHIFRVRKNLKNDFEPFNNIKNIGLPPNCDTPFGRANNENEPIFYGARQGDLALFESCQNIPEIDRYEPQNFTMGIWKIKANQTLRLIPLIENQLVKNSRLDVKTFSENKEKYQSQRITSQKLKDAMKLISTFFSDQFAKSKINSSHDYKISAFFANYVKNLNKSSTIKFDGILYPSVAYKFREDNVAIFPESLHKIEPVKCLSITAYNFDFDHATLTKGIFAEGKIDGEGMINWVEEF